MVGANENSYFFTLLFLLLLLYTLYLAYVSKSLKLELINMINSVKGSKKSTTTIMLWFYKLSETKATKLDSSEGVFRPLFIYVPFRVIEFILLKKINLNNKFISGNGNIF